MASERAQGSEMTVSVNFEVTERKMNFHTLAVYRTTDIILSIGVLNSNLKNNR